MLVHQSPFPLHGSPAPNRGRASITDIVYSPYFVGVFIVSRHFGGQCLMLVSLLAYTNSRYARGYTAEIASYHTAAMHNTRNFENVHFDWPPKWRHSNSCYGHAHRIQRITKSTILAHPLYETHLHLGSDHSVPMTMLVRSDFTAKPITQIICMLY